MKSLWKIRVNKENEGEFGFERKKKGDFIMRVGIGSDVILWWEWEKGLNLKP
jgi:hypothetical protein